MLVLTFESLYVDGIKREENISRGESATKAYCSPGNERDKLGSPTCSQY